MQFPLLLLVLLAACSGSEPPLPQHTPPYVAFSPVRTTRTRATE